MTRTVLSETAGRNKEPRVTRPGLFGFPATICASAGSPAHGPDATAGDAKSFGDVGHGQQRLGVAVKEHPPGGGPRLPGLPAHGSPFAGDQAAWFVVLAGLVVASGVMLRAMRRETATPEAGSFPGK